MLSVSDWHFVEINFSSSVLLVLPLNYFNEINIINAWQWKVYIECAISSDVRFVRGNATNNNRNDEMFWM